MHEHLTSAERHFSCTFQNIREAAIETADRIEEATGHLRTTLGTRADYPVGLDVAVFGSIARDEMTPRSDFGYLVIAHRTVPDPALFRDYRTAVEGAHEAMGIEPPGSSGLFGAVHLLDEGVVHGSREVAEQVRGLLESVEMTSESIAAEAAELGKRIAQLRDIEVLGGRFVTALGRLFAVGRAAVILRLLQDGAHVYDWPQAAEDFAANFPSLSTEVAQISELRPFYEALDGRRRPPRTNERDARALWSGALIAAERLVDVARPHLAQHA